MFGPSIPHYDAIYAWKDYAKEIEEVLRVLRALGAREGGTLLDVACGTGKHLELLKDRFRVEGLDLSDEMLERARRRLPDVPLHRGDMTRFDLGRAFDVVTCLFSSIGYALGDEALRSTARSLARHVAPGGVLLVEPWFSPEKIQTGKPHWSLVDRPDLKVCRMNVTELAGRTTRMDFHYLVGTGEGVEHYVERHEMWCATPDEVGAALRDAGLEATYDPAGLGGRGLHVGRRR